jgi:protein-tyrosine phosphatase
VIDLHAHILPGLDDGPVDLEASVALALAAVAAGTRVLAATSHVNRSYGVTAADLAAARRAVIRRLARERIPLEVVQGAEVSMGRLADLDDADLRAMTLGDGPCVLLECPFSPAADAMAPVVAGLLRRRTQVLLAHPERSPSIQRDPDLLGRLVSSGAMAQVTAGSLAGDFGDAARRSAFALVEAGFVHVLASDAHDHRHRPPGMGPGVEALRERYGDVEALAEWMTRRAPEAILAGRPVPAGPPLPSRPRRGLLRRRLRA